MEKKRIKSAHTWSFDISSLHSLWNFWRRSVNNLCISGETSAGISFCISSLFAFSHTHLRINIRRHTKSCKNESLTSSLLSINNQTKHLTLFRFLTSTHYYDKYAHWMHRSVTPTKFVQNCSIREISKRYTAVNIL